MLPATGSKMTPAICSPCSAKAFAHEGPASTRVKSSMRTREYVAQGESEAKSLIDAMREGSDDGMQEFDGVLEQMVHDGVIAEDVALTYATNRNNLKLMLSDLGRGEKTEGDGTLELVSSDQGMGV